MSLIKDFKSFAIRGNVPDLAVAIGAAFGRIVPSLVNDIIMPPIGILLSGIDFRELAFTLQEATAEASAITVNYGLFIQLMVDFVIVADAGEHGNSHFLHYCSSHTGFEVYSP